MKNKKDNKVKPKGIIAPTGKTQGKVKGKKKVSFFDCEQKQCGYFKADGCEKCQDCNAPPNKISDGCETCFACEYKPDSLRWGKEGHNDIISEALNNNFKKPSMISGNDFEKELKQEIIRQMASSIISGTIEKEMKEENINPNMIIKEEKPKIKRKEDSYIG